MTGEDPGRRVLNFETGVVGQLKHRFGLDQIREPTLVPTLDDRHVAENRASPLPMTWQTVEIAEDALGGLPGVIESTSPNVELRSGDVEAPDVDCVGKPFSDPFGAQALGFTRVCDPQFETRET